MHGLITATVILSVLSFITDLFYHLPSCALASIVFMAIKSLFTPWDAYKLWRQNVPDFTPFQNSRSNAYEGSTCNKLVSQTQ